MNRVDIANKEISKLTWGIIGLAKKFTRLLANTMYKNSKE